MSLRYAIGIDLGGTSIKYAIVGEGGDIVWNQKKPTQGQSSTDQILQNIIDTVEESRNVAQSMGITISSVGVGTPGLVDIETGVVKGGAENITGWKNLPLGDILFEVTGLDTVVDNDANFMGLGEYIFGNHQNRDMIFITLGTGIGGAIIINGKIHRGFNSAAGELGALVMNHNGKMGFWEDFASTSAMVNLYITKSTVESKEQINGKYIFRKYYEGEKLAQEVVNENADLVGMGIASYINIFNPEKVVIGGGISEAGLGYISKIHDRAMAYAMPDCSKGVEIVAAKLGNRAGFLGASHRALSKTKGDKIVKPQIQL